MSSIPVAIIGGSGVYQFPGLQESEEVDIDTPYGKPSDKILTGSLGKIRLAFLPRHGRHHSIAPSVLPYRANIYALKSLGVRWIISLSAVGSLHEKYKPRDFLIPLQFFDRTKNTQHHSFFERGIVAHASFGDPICNRLASVLFQSASAAGANCHWGGTYVNMEGPVFSTRAESEFHRKMNFDVIGMTNLAEAKLAREAEISYATVAMITDYDCWHESVKEVTVDDVVAVLKDNAELATETVRRCIGALNLSETTPCHNALATAFATPKEFWPKEQVLKLGPLIEKYI
ncbi:MAG: S-methyl-5'-thioadenosine phosphorylase [Verrucomicrobiota bacterium]